MSEWITRVRSHRIWELMKSLGPTIDGAVQLDDINAEVLDSLERFRSVLAFIGKRLGGSDPATVLPQTLDALASFLDIAATEINAFGSDHNIAHLANANNAADSALLQIHQVPGTASAEEVIALITSLSSYRATVEEQSREAFESRRQAKQDIEELRLATDVFKNQTLTTVNDLKAQLETERQRVSSLLAEQLKQFADAQEARGNLFNEALRKTQESLSTTLSDQQGQFSTAQENRSREFTTAQTESQRRFGDLIAEHTKRLTDQDAEFTRTRDAMQNEAEEKLIELHDHYIKDGDKILETVNARRQEVEKLVGVIGNLGVTSGYQKTANSARIAMWIWQTVAVSSLIVVIGFAYRAFLPAIQGDFKWGGFATRVFLTITVGVLAAYAARQGDRFFEIEKYNRKLALELAAIDPFIALLPLEEQHKFKLEIGRRSFAQEDKSAESSLKSPATALDVLAGTKEGQQMLTLLIEIATKLPKLPATP